MNIADDTDSIRKRLEEIEQERVKQIMGVPIEEPKAEIGEYAVGWPYGAAAASDYAAYTAQKFTYHPHGEDEPYCG